MAATHTTNLNLNKPDRQDYVSVVSDINQNMDMIDSSVGNIITPVFSPSTAYSVGDYVIYNRELYRFTTAHPAGAWNSSHVAKTNLAQESNSLKSAITQQTRNIIEGVIKNAGMNGAGYLSSETGAAANNFYYAPVTSGKTYHVTTDDASGLVCAFYTSIPAIGSTSYNSSRTVQASKDITAPINGYIAFRASTSYTYAQIEEGTSATQYIRPVTAIDAEAREDIQEISGDIESVERNVDNISDALEDGQKVNTAIHTVQNASIDSSGTVVTLSDYDLTVAFVGGATSVNISRGDVYSFYKGVPALGSKGTIRGSMSEPTTIDVPDGYNFVAVRNANYIVPLITPINNTQSELKALDNLAKRNDLVTGYIANAGISANGKIESLESRNVYYAPVYGVKTVHITKGELIAFYDCKPALNVYGIASRQSISDGEIVSVPDGAYYIGIRASAATSVYQYHSEWIVDKSGNGDFTTITAAVTRAISGDSIFIRSGNYTGETIEAWGKELHIVGEDKQTVIISNDLDDYDTPPIEMDIGSLENVTVIAVKKEGTAKGAYAMHIEDASEYGKTFTVRNCMFKAASGASVGMGMRGNYSVIFENCDFIATDYVASGTSGYAFYFHDTVDSNLVGADKVAFRNCRFYGKHSAGVVIRIDSNGLAGNTVEVEFVCNAIANPENDGSSNYLSLHNNGGTNDDWKHLKGFSNSILSYGNQQDTVDYGYTS